MSGPIRIAIGLLILGILFKILHWTVANLVFTGALVLIAVLYFFRFSNKANKQLTDYLKLIMVWSGVAHSVIFNFHWLYRDVASYVFLGATLLWLAIDRGNYFKRFSIFTDDKGDFEFGNILFRITSITVILGVLFKVLHLPFGDILLYSGLAIGAIWIASSFFNKD